jgi:O-antigen/teichoic acid export membrane protein
MFGYGTNTVLYISGSILIIQSAELVLGTLLSATAVSRFHVAATPVLLLIMAIQVFTSAVKPAVSDLDARSDDSRIEEIALLTQKYTLAVIMIALAYLTIVGDRFFEVWLGDRYSDPTAIAELGGISAALALGAACRLSQHTNFTILVGKGMHRVFGFAAVGTAAISIILSILVVRFMDGGPISVAWACAVPMILTSIGFLPVYFNHVMRIPFARTIRDAWLPAGMAALPGVGVVLAADWFLAMNSWLELVSVMALAGLSVGVVGWFVALQPVERARFRAVLPVRTKSR